jgi:hypothetical protein
MVRLIGIVRMVRLVKKVGMVRMAMERTESMTRVSSGYWFYNHTVVLYILYKLSYPEVWVPGWILGPCQGLALLLRVYRAAQGACMQKSFTSVFALFMFLFFCLKKKGNNNMESFIRRRSG